MLTVAFLPRQPPAGYTDRILAGLAPLLQRRGIRWLEDPPADQRRAADLLWAATPRVPALPLARPIILWTAEAGASLTGRSRQIAADPRCRLVAKIATPRPLDRANRYHAGHGTLHEAAILDALAGRPAQLPVPGRHRPPPLPPEALAKLVPAYSWLFLDRLAEPAAAARTAYRLGDDRPVDVFFAGSTRYGHAWQLVTWHRQAAVAAIRGLDGARVEAYSRRRLSPADYRAALARAKIAVSPWGHADTCIRDVEALMAGCVLIKPGPRLATTWPDYHQPGPVEYCRADWSDLQYVVDQILGHDYPRRRRWARSAGLALAMLADRRTLADRIAALCYRAAGDHPDASQPDPWQRLRVDHPWPAERPPLTPDAWGWWNHHTARAVDAVLPAKARGRPAGTIVELGAYLGKGTLWLACRCERVLSVDHWLGNAGFIEAPHIRDRMATAHAQWLANCWPKRDKITALRRPTVEALREIAAAGLAVDAVYVDAGHSEAEVSADLAAIGRHLPDARIAGDDYGRAPVARAVDRYADAHGLAVRVDGPAYWLEPR